MKKWIKILLILGVVWFALGCGEEKQRSLPIDSIDFPKRTPEDMLPEEAKEETPSAEEQLFFETEDAGVAEGSDTVGD